MDSVGWVYPCVLGAIPDAGPARQHGLCCTRNQLCWKYGVVGVTIPWFVLVTFLSYQHGVKQKKLPEPRYFIGATAAMSIAGLVGIANGTAGMLFAWALVAGAFVSGKMQSVPPDSEKGPLDNTPLPSPRTPAKPGQIPPLPPGTNPNLNLPRPTIGA